MDHRRARRRGITGVFLRGSQLAYARAIAEAILGVAVATQNLGGALVFGGTVTILTGAVCIFVMPEHGFRRRPATERLSAARELKRNAVVGARLIRGHHVLLLIVRDHVLRGRGLGGPRPALGGASHP